MRISPPLKVFIAYLIFIIAYAFWYHLVPSTLGSHISFFDSLYFSVVTITTLGYGDLTPISDFGKFLAASESLLGVILLGVFFLAASHELIYIQEKKRINSGKENLKMQYAFWRKNTVMSLLFLSGEKAVSGELQDKLYNYKNFRDYFRENKRWYAVGNNLSNSDYYTKELVKDLELLQRHIETFITIIPISDTGVLQSLSGYVSVINNLVKLDLNEDYDDQKTFIKGLSAMMTLCDHIDGEHNRDYLMEAIDKV